MDASDIFCFEYFLTLLILCIVSTVFWVISWILAMNDSSSDACPLITTIATISGLLAAIMAGTAMGQFVDIVIK